MRTRMKGTGMGITLSDWLRTEIENRGWSEREAADAIGVSKTAVNALLKYPDRIPELATLDKMSKAFDVPLLRLVEICGFDADWGKEPPVSTRLARIAAAHPSLAEIQERLLKLNLEDFAATLEYLEGLTLRRAALDRSDEE